jgi:hypothetical protein
MTEQTTDAPREACIFPGCERPAVDDRGALRGCAQHRAHYGALSELEAWEAAQSVLEPWYATTSAIGLEKLTEAMDAAMDHLDEGLKKDRAEEKRTEAVL